MYDGHARHALLFVRAKHSPSCHPLQVNLKAQRLRSQRQTGDCGQLTFPHWDGIKDAIVGDTCPFKASPGFLQSGRLPWWSPSCVCGLGNHPITYRPWTHAGWFNNEHHEPSIDQPWTNNPAMPTCINLQRLTSHLANSASETSRHLYRWSPTQKLGAAWCQGIAPAERWSTSIG